MGDYSFFIKSTTFILLLNAAIFSFPEEVEALTGGALNTSTVSGTNVSIDNPDVAVGQLSDRNQVDLSNPISYNNVQSDSDTGFLVIGSAGSNTGYAKYNISNFDTDEDGNYEVFVSGYRETIFGESPLKIEYEKELSDGSTELNNYSVKYLQPFAGEPSTSTTLTDVSGEVVTAYFNDDASDRKGYLRSIENSLGITDANEQDLTKQFLDNTGLSGFGDSLQNLISLYTAPSTGNQVLGAIFTIYLLGFIVFLLKEVVPG